MTKEPTTSGTRKSERSMDRSRRRMANLVEESISEILRYK